MTDKDYTLIAILADRTGSMGEFADGDTTKAVVATNGIHDLIREQRKLPGKTEFQLTAFDWMGTTNLEKIAPGNGDAILAWTCMPRGNTPLYDAMGMTITEIGERLEKMPEHERPGTVFFVTATDGLNNWSSEYTRERVAEMIRVQSGDYGWQFTYIGSGFEDFAGDAASLGVSAAATMSSTPAAMAASYGAHTSAMTRARQTGTAFAYSSAERQTVADAEENGETQTAQWKSTGRADRSKK